MKIKGITLHMGWGEGESQKAYILRLFISVFLYTFLSSCSFPAVKSAYICIFPTHTVHISPQDTIDDSPFLQSLLPAGL